MSPQAVLAVMGALSGTAGSIITAFSVNNVLSELHLSQRFVSTTVERLATDHPEVPIFTGTDKRIDKAKAKSSLLVWSGVILLALGFILQAASALS